MEDQIVETASVEQSSGLDSGSSPETQVAQETQSPQGTNDTGSAPLPAAKEENVPFHMHPRFQEVINQKNELALKMSEIEKTYQRQLYEMQMRMQEIQGRIPAKQPAVNPALERLKEADPQVAEYIKSLEDKVEQALGYGDKFSEIEQWRAQQLQAQTENQVNSLYDKYKVPEDQRMFVRTMLNNLASQNPDAKVSDLENYFKQAHETVNKAFSNYTRNEVKNYVVDKKKDAVPASTTGGATPKHNQTNKFESKIDRMKFIAEGLKAAKEQA